MGKTYRYYDYIAGRYGHQTARECALRLREEEPEGDEGLAVLAGVIAEQVDAKRKPAPSILFSSPRLSGGYDPERRRLF